MRELINFGKCDNMSGACLLPKKNIIFYNAGEEL